MLGNNPTDQGYAIDESERLRLEKDSVVAIMAFGDSYNADGIRVMANSPSLFHRVRSSSPSDLADAEAWLLEIFGFATTPSTPLPNPTQPPQTGSTTTVSGTTSPPQYCREVDVVFVFQRSCFDSQSKFNSNVQPILTNFGRSLDPCVKINTAYVEYASWSNLRYGYSYFDSSQQARVFMSNGSYKIGTDGGTLANADEGWRTVRYNVLRDASARSLNNPTQVFTFLCQTPTNQMRAIEQIEGMRLEGAVSSIVAYGDQQDTNALRIYANAPENFYQMPLTNGNFSDAGQWMTTIVYPPASTIIPDATTTMAVPTTTEFEFNETTTVDFNATTTVEFNETTTVDFNETTTVDLNSTLLPDPGVPTTTVAPTTTIQYCAWPDLVFVMEHACFYEKGPYNESIQPVLRDFANSLDPCVKISTAYVEFSEWSELRYTYTYFEKEITPREMMQNYQLATYNHGNKSYIEGAFRTVNYQVGNIS